MLEFKLLGEGIFVYLVQCGSLEEFLEEWLTKLKK